MGELDRIAWAFSGHDPSMPSLAVRSTRKNFKLTHYPTTLHNTCYRK